MIESQNRLIELLQSHRPIEGLTHSFYRYPARFAPEFAREVILGFSREGDCVLDAFMGGGTTVVEAIATGRAALGVDINPLAHFIATAKTTPLSSRDKEAILGWANGISLDERIPVEHPALSDPRLKDIPADVKCFLICATLTIRELGFPRQKRFARCALLRLGQWAIDCRRDFPPVDRMKTQLLRQVTEMLDGLDELVLAAKSQGIPKNKITGRRILCLGTVNDVIRNNSYLRAASRPKLVLTSPPYPGVHVLYHRWQVSGRRETPAPYWLANLRDGHGESFYTLGGRSKKGLENYFTRLTETFGVLRQFIDPGALVVQLVAFSNPDVHLPAFLTAMTHAGYEELNPFGDSNSERPLRKVPNRKWYTQLTANQYASNEILLFHRPQL
jgi:hypothetical protein